MKFLAESKILLNSISTMWRQRHEIMKLPLKTMASKSLENYQSHIETKTPMMTTVLTITGTYVVGQTLAQILTQNFDPNMIGVYALYGPLGGICFYKWFHVLDRIPGMMLVKSNTYQNFIFEKIPSILGNHVSIHLKREVYTPDSLVKGNVKLDDGYTLSEGTKIPTVIPEGTHLAMSSLTFVPSKISTVNKWALKITKILADQLIFSSFYTLFLISTVGLLSGHNLVEIAGTIQSSFWTIYKWDCVVWPVIQYFNFTYVNRSMQPIVVNIANIGWNCFLCMILGSVH